MTDYAFLAEDLNSQVYVIIAIQPDLKSDEEIQTLLNRSSTCDI